MNSQPECTLKTNRNSSNNLPSGDENSSFLATWSFPIICFAALFLSPVIMAAMSSLKVHSNDVKQWLSILYWTGGTMNLTMVMLPTLTFIMGVSAAIHMANYYRKAVQHGEGLNAADIALKAG